MKHSHTKLYNARMIKDFFVHSSAISW